MNMNQLTETIERWTGYLHEREAADDLQGAERMRNWLFGAGISLRLLDDEALQEISQRALEASENGIARNRNVGAGDDGAMGHSRMDSQRENLPTDVETEQ